MKKLCLLFVFALMLTGCGGVQTFETINDDISVPATAVASDVQIALPDALGTWFLQGEDDSRLYLCDDFSVVVQTLSGGDINSTVETVTGFDKDMLLFLESKEEGFDKYLCAWSTAGEGENQVCRTLIIDGGDYHYAVTVMADYSKAGDLADTWQQILRSVSLNTD